MQDELSMQLGQLYFRIADGSVQQKTLRDRVKQAAEMPVQMQLVKHLNQNAAMQFALPKFSDSISHMASVDVV